MVMCMLDPRLDTFLVLCKMKSYTKAAQILNLTQPAVSQHIRYLETYFGGKLFTYTNRTLNLTPKGELLYRFASTMQSDSTRVLELLRSDHPEPLQLRIGTTLTIGEYVMPTILTRLLETYPHLQIKMPVLNTKMLLRKLQDGEIDVALVEGYFNSAEYEVQQFSAEPFIAVCGSGHPLAKSAPPYPNIFKERLIVREKGSGTREVLEHILQELNLSLRSFTDVCEVGNLNAIKELVKNNLGISFMYQAAAQRELDSGQLIKLSFSANTFTHSFSFVFLKDSIHRDEYLFWLKEITKHDYRPAHNR